MIPRTALRTTQRAVRVNRNAVRRNARFESTASKVTPDTAAGSGGASGAITGGLAGGGAALLAVCGWYHFSGAKTAVQTAKQTKSYVDSATESLKIKFEENTPDTDTALKTLRDAANKYATFIPGARQYVDSTFNDLETIRKKHGGEVDEAVSQTYGELREASKNGMSMQTAGDVYSILTKLAERLLELGKDSAEEVLNNHPQLKEKLGGSADQLKQLGERIGPQAKKEIDETWKQVNELVQGGLTAGTLVKAQSLLQEKTQKLREMGQQAFDQGWEQVKPLLEKNPKVKEFVDSNMDALKQGNVSETVSKIKDAVQSGDLKDLQQYVDQAKNKAQQYSPSSVSSWLDKIPNGSEIIPQIQKLWQIAEQRGDKAEKLAKETMEEIKQVLDKKTQEAEKLAEGAKEEAKEETKK